MLVTDMDTDFDDFSRVHMPDTSSLVSFCFVR